MLKICTKCKEEKTLEQFHNHKRVKGGKVARCKLCNINRKIYGIKKGNISVAQPKKSWKSFKLDSNIVFIFQ